MTRSTSQHSPSDGPADAAAIWLATEMLRHTPEVEAARRAGRQLASRRRLRHASWVLPAAAAAIGVFIWTSYFRGIERTDIAEIRELTLPDGSHVVLDAESAIRTRFIAGARFVDLVAGRAEFDVAHDPARPFIVTADGTQVRAVGTRFTMEREADGLEVVLIEGKVVVEPDHPAPSTAGPTSAAVNLSAGRKITVGAAGQISAPVAVDVARATVWRDKRLDLDNETLGWAVAEANRYSPVQISLADPELGALRVTTVFGAGDNAEFAAALSARFGLELTRPTANLIMLSRGKKTENNLPSH